MNVLLSVKYLFPGLKTGQAEVPRVQPHRLHDSQEV